MTTPPGWAPLDDLPWIVVTVSPAGFQAACTVCGARFVGGEAAAHAFADNHAAHTSPSPTHFGAGDLVAAAAKAVGFTKPCTPCEARRQAMNTFLPAVPFMRR